MLDVDGTLLNREYDTNKLVWEKLNIMAKGNYVVCLITARPYAYAHHILNRLPLKTYHMFDRGGYIANNSDFGLSITIPNELVNSVTLKLKEYQSSIRFGLSRERHFFANDNYLNEISGYLEGDYFETINHIGTLEGVNSIWIRDLPGEVATDIMKLNNENLSVKSVRGRSENTQDVFVNSKSSNKEVFVNYLCEINNCSLSESIGIGDSNEDLSFLKLSKKVYCPQNATTTVKDISSYISPETYSNGVLDILSKLED